MRIIAGEFRGRKLDAPKGDGTRPTTDRVRESLMSALVSLRDGLDGAVVLDAFAGSGALSLEALSRGADTAVLCERDRDAAAVIERNICALRLGRDRARLVRGDVLKRGAAAPGRPFDLVFLDPPYAEKSLETAIQRLSEIDILSDGGIIITERPLGKPLAEEFPGLTRSKDYHYGKTTITLLRKTGAGGGND